MSDNKKLQTADVTPAVNGSRFDIRTFHDQVLAGGSLPLDVLDARITRWISRQTPAASK